MYPEFFKVISRINVWKLLAKLFYHRILEIKILSNESNPYHEDWQMCATCQNRLIWWAGSSNTVIHPFTIIKSNNRIDSICLVLTFVTTGCYYQIMFKKTLHRIHLWIVIWLNHYDGNKITFSTELVILWMIK